MDKILAFFSSNNFLEIIISMSITLISAVAISLLFDLIFVKIKNLSFKKPLKIGSDKISIEINNIDESINRINQSIQKYQEHPLVFLSYSQSDKKFAQKLANDLIEQEIHVWRFDEQIKLGDSIQKKILDGINNSQWFCIILSPNSEKSDWISEELLRAMESEEKRERSFVIPILYKKTTIPEFIKDKKYADFRRNYEDALKILVSRLKNPLNGDI